jgi:6-pyruvoyltetrahydropterin/6-carboxytetrahydropterin synthase
MAHRKNQDSRKEKIRITKTFRFEMAHALLNYEGACRNIHGHSYELSVTVIGSPLNQREHPKDGLVVDFHDIKQAVQKTIIEHFDHALVLNSKTPADTVRKLQKDFAKVTTLPFQPTCENLVIEFKERLLPIFDGSYKLFSLRLEETKTCWAEWFRTDNN